MYTVILIVVNLILEQYLCLNYLCLFQEKLSKFSKTAMKQIYANISVIGITDILMKLVSCNGFNTYKKAITILTCRRFLFSYYLSKRFLFFNITTMN